MRCLTLKNVGIGERTILAILAAGRIPAGSPAPGKQRNALPERMGIYILKDGEYISLEPEPVEWRFGFLYWNDHLGRANHDARSELNWKPFRARFDCPANQSSF